MEAAQWPHNPTSPSRALSQKGYRPVSQIQRHLEYMGAPHPPSTHLPPSLLAVAVGLHEPQPHPAGISQGYSTSLTSHHHNHTTIPFPSIPSTSSHFSLNPPHVGTPLRAHDIHIQHHIHNSASDFPSAYPEPPQTFGKHYIHNNLIITFQSSLISMKPHNTVWTAK